MSAVDSSLAAKCMDFCHALTSQDKSFTFSLTLGSNFTFSLDTKENLSPASKAVKRKKSPSAKRRNERRRAEFLVKRSETQGTVIQGAADIIDVTLATKDGQQDDAQQVVLNSNEDTPRSLSSSIPSPSTTAPSASFFKHTNRLFSTSTFHTSIDDTNIRDFTTFISWLEGCQPQAAQGNPCSSNHHISI